MVSEIHESQKLSDFKVKYLGSEKFQSIVVECFADKNIKILSVMEIKRLRNYEIRMLAGSQTTYKKFANSSLNFAIKQ